MSEFKNKNNIFNCQIFAYATSDSHMKMLEGYKIHFAVLKNNNPNVDFILNEKVFVLLNIKFLTKSDRNNRNLTGLYYPIINDKIPWDHQSDVEFVTQEVKDFYDKLWKLKVFS